MSYIQLAKRRPELQGTIPLDGSKSISNRALIALALAGEEASPWLSNCSTSNDTKILRALLASGRDIFDAGDAGTSFRFLCAFLAIQPGEQQLTGSARMLERPIAPLVDALRTLGADIAYLGKEGYPPLKIGQWTPRVRSVRVPATVSSQFLSALLLIGPYLPEGLELIPEGPASSRPYLDMTIQVMRHFGARVAWNGDSIEVEKGTYTPKPLNVESDWSAASYWYAMAAFSEQAELRLLGLQQNSWQGDAAVSGMMQKFGIQTIFDQDSILLRQTGSPPRPVFEQDFRDFPDLAQTLAVVCAGLGITGLFSGMDTLHIKETDRIAALKAELAKLNVTLAKLPAHFSKKWPDRVYYNLLGKADLSSVPRFATYGDHRMAMAFAPLAMLGPVEIEHPEVVEKSYPLFWEHLKQAGFETYWPAKTFQRR